MQAFCASRRLLSHHGPPLKRMCLASLATRRQLGSSLRPLCASLEDSRAMALANKRQLSTSLARRQQTRPEAHDHELAQEDPDAFSYRKDENPFRPPRLWRHLLFASIFVFVTFDLASGLTEEDTVLTQVAMALHRRETLTGKLFGGQQPEDFRTAEMQAAKNGAHVLRTQELLSQQRTGFQALDRAVGLALMWWGRQSEAQRTCLGLIGVQAVVFLGWKVPALSRLWNRVFLEYPWGTRSRAYQTLTCVFSHKSVFHFGLNSLAFYSFGPTVHDYFLLRHFHPEAPPVASSRNEFVAFFLCAGVIASLTSFAFSRIVRWPLLLRAVSSGRANGAALFPLPSLGASGAIFSCFSFSAFAFPDNQVQIIFLPMFQFSIQNALFGTMAVDAFCLIFGRRLLGIAFDNAAHLAGAAFGILYYYYGNDWFDSIRSRYTKAEVDALLEEKARTYKPSSTIIAQAPVRREI